MSEPTTEIEAPAGPGTDTPLSAAGALMELKRRITSITKDGHNPQGNFAFRGIDQVMNACGPIEREIGMLVLPTLHEEHSEQVEYGAKRTLGFRTRVQVEYTVIGPDGSRLDIGPIPGEAMDSGDKGTAKAMSVALRTMYLQVLTVPTGEPDPDESTYEVSKPEAVTSDPMTMAKLRERIKNADTDPKLRTVYNAIVAEHEGEKATITLEDRQTLVNEVTARKAELDAAAAGEQTQLDDPPAGGTVSQGGPG